MKHLFTTLLCLLALFWAYSQEKEQPYLVDEYNISLNRAGFKPLNSNDGLGFGIGITRLLRQQKKLNVSIGFEYNLTRRYYEYTSFKKEQYIKHNLNNITIPIGLRYNLGQKIIFFMEFGLFTDIVFRIKTKVLTITQNIDETTKKTEGIYIHSLPGHSFGLTNGIGLKIPINNRQLIIKTDYRFEFYFGYYLENMFNNYYRIVFGLSI
ncbi:MAG TPA: hypothetical protein EYG85_06320 [Crocinitomix sp.]|nr:hypothetical protein [Crocinitomix sp.]